MRMRTSRLALTEQERMAVVVTEMLRLAMTDDESASVAARQILAKLVDEPSMSDDDRRLARVASSAPRS